MKGKGIKMARLIDADEAFRVLSDYYHHRTETQADALREALDRVPEVVVRCKDCKYCYFQRNLRALLCRYRECSTVVNAGDYCSRGERRPNEP